MTERGRVEGNIGSSEEFFRQITKNSSDIIFIVDKNGAIIYVSPSVGRFLGYAADEMIGESALEFIHPAEVSRAMLDFESAARGTQRHALNSFRVLHKDGSERILEGFAKNLFDDPVIAGLVMNVHDITEHKRVKKAMLELTSRQQALLSAIPDIIMSVDADKVYTWANEPGIDFFGKDVIGREATYYFEGEQNTYEAVKPLFNGDENVIYVESWRRNRHGAKRLLAWWRRVLKDQHGNMPGALSTARDITERRLGKEALRRSESLHCQTQRITKAGGWEYDVEKGRLTWTDEGYRIYGVSSDHYDPDNIARNFAFLRTEPPSRWPSGAWLSSGNPTTWS
jgi:PAS domain S-box-containing protein